MTLGGDNTYEPIDNTKSIKNILAFDIRVGGSAFSPIFGNLKYLSNDNGLEFECVKTGEKVKFLEDGKFSEGGEVMLFPSEKQHDWTKVPIRYPQSYDELFGLFFSIHNYSKEELESYKSKYPLHFYLNRIAYIINKIGGVIDHKKSYTYEVMPTPFCQEKTLSIEFTWEVRKLTNRIYHFGFYKKEAATTFAKIMADELNEFAKQIYFVDSQYRSMLNKKVLGII